MVFAGKRHRTIIGGGPAADEKGNRDRPDKPRVESPNDLSFVAKISDLTLGFDRIC